MQWNRSNVLGLARVSCCTCHGNGLRVVRKGREVACHCVYRAIFRACYNRFRECVANGEQTSIVSLEFCPGKDGRRTYSRKKEEYMADFCLVSKRELSEADYSIFRYHFLLGADWKLCCRQLGMDRGNFFHAIYRIEQALGKVFAELTPYALYPLDEYFGGSIRRRLPAPLPPLTPAHARRRRPAFPMLQAA